MLDDQGVERIVVGVDGSEGSKAALRWAVAEGAARRVALTVLLASDDGHEMHEDLRPVEQDDHRSHALEVLGTIVRETLGDGPVPELEVSGEHAVPALVGASGPDRLVVVGARGLGGFTGLLLGSVSQRLATKALGPVAVIPTEPINGSTIVVGVDGSDESITALRWAAEEARAKHVSLTLVQAWHFPATAADPWFPIDGTLLVDLERVAHDQLQRAATAPALTGLTVNAVLRQGNAAHAILSQKDAIMAVVGSHGAGRVAGLLLGSVAHQVLHHTQVPVVIVPSPASPERPDESRAAGAAHQS